MSDDRPRPCRSVNASSALRTPMWSWGLISGSSLIRANRLNGFLAPGRTQTELDAMGDVP